MSEKSELQLDPATTAFIIVDMQKCFCKPSGSLYSERSQAVIPRIQTFLQRARENDLFIIYTKDTHEQKPPTDHYNEFERWGKHCVQGTSEWEIVPELQPQEEDVIIEKNTYDAFHETRIDQVLVSTDINTVLVGGVLTNVCVLHTASSAALHDYRTIVLSNCTAALKDDHKDYALKHVDFLFGKVLTSADVEFKS